MLLRLGARLYTKSDVRAWLQVPEFAARSREEWEAQCLVWRTSFHPNAWYVLSWFSSLFCFSCKLFFVHIVPSWMPSVLCLSLDLDIIRRTLSSYLVNACNVCNMFSRQSICTSTWILLYTTIRQSFLKNYLTSIFHAEWIQCSSCRHS